MSAPIEFELGKLAACVLLWAALILIALSGCACTPANVPPPLPDRCFMGKHQDPNTGSVYPLECLNRE